MAAGHGTIHMQDAVLRDDEKSCAVKKRMTFCLYSPRVCHLLTMKGDLMSSDKGFVSKGLVLVWRTEKQPSGCA